MRKALLIIAGFLCLAIGFIGVFIPVLPTTPFVLLAGTCFVSSSPALYEHLKKIPIVGPFILHYNQKTGVSRKDKAAAILFLWAGLILSMFLLKTLYLSLILSAIGIAVTIHIAALKPDQWKSRREQ